MSHKQQYHTQYHTMGYIMDIANRVDCACSALKENVKFGEGEKACYYTIDVYVLKDVHEHGFTDDEMVALYEAVCDDTGELCSERGYPCNVLCTAWLHAARQMVKRGAEVSSSAEVLDMLNIADKVMRELGQRSGHPTDGSVAKAVQGCLSLGRAVGVHDIEKITEYFSGYGGMYDSNGVPFTGGSPGRGSTRAML